ncbi:2OG-Fe dioxygenase family protein [Coralliovum pocilloporae]|uniref:2OG-Fe dioxygenase family protein n=1 Tax=Coralliovum pocilloporae TaxID=3066369 RepID=UPI003307A7D0
MLASIDNKQFFDWNIEMLVTPELQASYDELHFDDYHPDGTRTRRFSQYYLTFEDGKPEFESLPVRPFSQKLLNNPLVGNQLRYFPPVKTDLRPFILSGFSTLGLSQSDSLQVNCHQIRIEGKPEQFGRSSPEGIHRDGVDFVLMGCINRVNVMGGESRIYDDNKNLVHSRTLQTAEGIIVDDRIGYHYASEFELQDPSKRGFRDMLIIAFMDKDAGRYGPNYEVEVAGIEGDTRKIAEVSMI